MKADNEMKLEFLSKSQNESFARSVVAAFVAQLDPTIEELAEIKTAVSEAVKCHYTWIPCEMGNVMVISRLIGNTVEIEVKDFGGIADIELARHPYFKAGA